MITDVAPDSVGASSGLEPGDVVVKLNKTETATRADYAKAVKSVKPGDVVLVRVRRGNQAQFLTLRVPK